MTCTTCDTEILTGQSSDTFRGESYHDNPDDCVRPLKETIERYERGLKAIKDSTLNGADFAEWVQALCEDLLAGLEAECPVCGTHVHDGPCVEGSEDD